MLMPLRRVPHEDSCSHDRPYDAAVLRHFGVELAVTKMAKYRFDQVNPAIGISTLLPMH